MSITELTRSVETARPPRESSEFPSTVPEEFFGSRSWEWRSGPCAAVDHAFEVSVESATEVVRVIAPVTSPLQTSVLGPGHGRYRIVRRSDPLVPYALYYGTTRLTLARGAETLVRHLTWHINQTMIEKTTVDNVVLHAACATRAGITLILPGDQEHGKTTTVAGLLREGYGYVTDEAVAIDPATLRIRPFPKALSLDDGSWHLFPECRPTTSDHPPTRQWQVPAECLGSRAATRSVLPPKVIVFPEYVAGSRTHAGGLTRAQAVRELAESTFQFRTEPARNLRTLAAVVRDAHVARLRIGSLDEAVLAIEEMVSQSIRKELHA